MSVFRRIVAALFLAFLLYCSTYNSLFNYLVGCSFAMGEITQVEWTLTLFWISFSAISFYARDRRVIRTLIYAYLGYMTCGFIAYLLRLFIPNDTAHLALFALCISALGIYSNRDASNETNSSRENVSSGS